MRNAAAGFARLAVLAAGSLHAEARCAGREDPAGWVIASEHDSYRRP